MQNIVVTGGDILTSLGDIQTTWNAMLTGKSGLMSHQLSSVKSELPIGIITDLEGGGGSWLRLKNMLARLLVNVPVLPDNTHLFCAPTKGAVDELLSAPQLAEGQPWQLADYIKEILCLKGQAATVSAACASGNLAIIQGAMRIATGACDHALIVGVDLVGDFIVAGFDSLKALSTEKAKPFDIYRDGLSLGDGGGWLLLSATEKCDEITNEPLACLEGWGISCDATHITAPCREASGLKAALGQILHSAGIEIGGINAHGTGTVFNDAMELLAFNEVCGNQVPICSVKGAIGHTLGAAGVVEAMISVQSLKHTILPPTIGLIDPAKEAGMISGERALQLNHPSILSCNSGFGGINAAIYLTL